MPKLIDNNNQTLEQGLQKRLDQNLSGINTSTLPSLSQQVRAVNPQIVESDKNMFERIGTGLFEFGSEAAESLIDTALFGVPSALGIYEPGEDVDTVAEKVGQAVGGAAGFLVPFGAVRGGLNMVARGLAGAKSAPKLAKTMDDQAKEVFKKYSDDVLSFDNELSAFYKSPMKGLQDQVFAGTTKKIANFDRTFKSIRDKDDFVKRITDNAGKYLTEQADELGFKLANKSKLLDELGEIVSTNLAKANNQPINGMQTYLASKFGSGLKGSFMSHVVEEALLFAGAENLMLTVDALAGDATLEDFAGTSKHALVLGSILGGVRFIPGGVAGGIGGIKKGPERIARIMAGSRNYTKSLNPSVESAQKGILSQYEYFAGLTGSNIVSGTNVRKLLNDKALDILDDVPKVNAARRAKLQTQDVSRETLERIVMSPESTPEQKQAAAEIMQDGLQFLASHINREWREGMLRTWGADIVGSSPRMLIGGIAMAGGPTMLLSEDVPLEDKLIGFFMGAFITKGGKKLEWRSGEKYNEVNQLGKDPKTIDSRLIEQEHALKALGTSFDGNPSYRILLQKAHQANSDGGRFLNNQVQPKTDEFVIKLDNPEAFQVRSQTAITSTNAVASKSGYKPVYDAYIALGESKTLLTEGNRYKDWSELSKKEKDNFIKRVEQEGISTPEQMIEYSSEIKTESFADIERELAQTYERLQATIIGTREVPQIQDISIENISGRIDTELAQAIKEYNALGTILKGSGNYEVNPRAFAITSSKDVQQSFKETYQNSLEGFNKYMSEQHNIQNSVEFSDSVLRSALDLNRININVIKAAANKNGEGILDVFNTNANFSNTFRAQNDILAAKIQVKGNKTLEKKMNAILDVVSKFDDSYDKLFSNESASVKTIDAKQARNILEILKDKGIMAFASPADYSIAMPINAMGRLITSKYMRNLLINGTDNTGRLLTQTDRNIIQVGMDHGIIGSNLQYRPVTEAMFKVVESDVLNKITKDNNFSAIESFVGQSNAETAVIKQTLKEVKQVVGDTPGSIFRFNEIFENTVKMIDDTFGKYVRGTDGKGVLNRSDLTSGGDFIQVNQLAQRLNLIKNNMVTEDVRLFLNDIYQVDRVEFAGTKKAMKSLMNMMTFSKNPIKLYESAIKYDLYDTQTRSWKTDKLSETQVEARLKEMRDNKIIDFVDTEKAATEIREQGDFFPKDFTEQNKIKLGEILNTYALPTDSKFRANDLLAEQPLKKIQEVYNTPEYQNNFNKFSEDFVNDVVKQNPKLSQAEIDGVRMSMKSFYTQLKNNTEVEILEFNANAPDNSMTRTDIKNRTPIDDALLKAMGDAQPFLRQVNSNTINTEGLPGPLIGKSMESFRQKAFEGDYTLNTFEKVDLTQAGKDILNNKAPVNAEPGIIYRFADSDNVYFIRKNQDVLNNIANRYAEVLKKFDPKNIDTKLKKVDIVLNEGKYEYTIGSAWQKETQKLTQILDDILLSDTLGGENIFGTGFRQQSGIGLIKGLFKRDSLINNNNALRFDKQLVQFNIVEANKIKFESDTYKTEVIEKLKQFRDGKLKQVTVADELPGAIDNLVSINKQINDSYDIEIGLAKDPKIQRQLQEQKSQFNIQLQELGIADASTVNGVTIVSDKTFKMLSFLSGETSSSSVGGIKPIMYNLGNGPQLFINKTAFLKNNNSKVEQIFKNNPDLDFITFTSASKKITKERMTPVISMSKLISGKNIKEIVPIGPENIAIISTKKNKKFASLGANNSVHLLNRTQRNEYYDYYIRDINGFDNKRAFIQSLKNPANYAKMIAEFQRLSTDRINNKLNSDLEVFGNDTLMKLLADSGAMPTIKTRMWEDMIKQQYLDKMFQLKVDGSTAVLAPGTFLADTKLQNTIILENGQHYKFGEIELPYSAQFKPIDKNNITLVKKLKGAADEVVNGASKEGQAIIKDVETLGEAVKNAEKVGYQVLSFFERQPHTKPSSVMPVGIKKFRSRNEADQIVLNDADLKRAAEGDFDIDSGSAIWKMPHNVALGFIESRGKVLDSVPLGVGSNPSFKDIDFTNFESRERYVERKYNAQYVMGSAINANRIVQKILSGKSTREGEFFDGRSENKIIIAKTGDQRFIGVRADVNKTYQRIADLVQSILDKDNGYDSNIFKDINSLYDDIFFGIDGNGVRTNKGLFQLYKLTTKDTAEGAKYEQVDAEFSSTEIKLLKENIIQPYRQLLKLNNRLYDSGQQRKVSLRDIATYSSNFDTQLFFASKNAKKKLGNPKNVESVFSGYTKSLMLYGENTNMRSSLTFDRLIADMSQIKNLLLEPTKANSEGVLSETISTAIEFMEAGTTGTKKFVENFNTDVQKYNAAKQIDVEIRRKESYMKKINKFESPEYYETLSNRLDKLKTARESLKNAINVSNLDKNMFALVEQRYVTEALAKEYRKQPDLDSKQKQEIIDQAKEQFKKEKLDIDFVDNADLVNNIALSYAFSYRGNRTLESMGIKSTELSRDFETEIKDLKDFYNKSWKDYFNLNNKEVFHPDQIKQNMFEKIDRILDRYNDVAPEFILTKIMTPRVDFTKIVKYQDKYFPKPIDTNTESFINLVTGYALQSPRFSKQFTGDFVRDYSGAYNQVYLKLHGINSKFSSDGLPLEITTGEVYQFPHLLPTGHTRDAFSLFQSFNPEETLTGRLSSASRLDSYQTFLDVFGTATVKDVLSGGNLAPSYSITKNRIEAIDGMHTFQNSLKNEALFNIFSRKSEDSLKQIIKGTETDIDPYITKDYYDGGTQNVKEFISDLGKTTKEVC
tara:strand:- start:3285 stop:11606 length:8322 start_codon:yes stop_codon:yes gene_type:complete